jgi:ureidoglycolate lyase
MRRVISVPGDIALAVSPIDKDAFAPFGELIDFEPSGTRTDKIGGIANQRADARFHLSTARIAPTSLPLSLSELERHPFSSQSFLPLDASRYLICVAGNDPGGWPDLQSLRAFAVPKGVGITYRAGTWHHPMIALDTPASFAIVMWCGDDANEEFVDLSRPVTVGAG